MLYVGKNNKKKHQFVIPKGFVDIELKHLLLAVVINGIMI